MLSANTKDAETYLKLAEPIIQQGCAGHNYYRFYKEAIESTLRHELYDQTTHYMDKFRQFTDNEPCPWSDYYLKRAEALLPDVDEKNRFTVINALIDEAREIHLLSAIPQLEEALKH